MKTSEAVKNSNRPKVFCENVVLKSLAKFTGKHLCQSLFLLKKRHWHWCFPVNLAKFLRTPIFIERIWWQLLKKLCWTELLDEKSFQDIHKFINSFLIYPTFIAFASTIVTNLTHFYQIFHFFIS